MKAILIVYIFIFSVVTGCSLKKTATTGIKIKLGSIISNFPGGIIISGKNQKTQEFFSEVIAGSDLTKNLTNGSWKFYGILWDGTTPMSGSPKCAEPVSINLNGSDTTVSLNFTGANCLSSDYSIPNSSYSGALMGLYFNICPSTTSFDYVSTNGYCGNSYYGLATGIKINFISSENFPSNGSESVLSSQCFKLSNGYAGTELKIPTFPTNDALMPAFVDVYYSSSGSSCSGDDCCLNSKTTYKFKEAISKPSIPNLAANKNSSLVVIEQPPLSSILFQGSSFTNPVFNTCMPATVNYIESGAEKIADSDLSITVDCNNTCHIYSDSTCTTMINGPTITAGDTSANFYFKPFAPSMTIQHTGVNDIAGDIKIGLNVSTDYPNFNYQYVFPNMPISRLPVLPFISGSIYAFRTRSDNRGKLKVEAVTTTAVASDTITVSYET